MKKSIIGLLVVVVLIALLAITKPSPYSFDNYVDKNYTSVENSGNKVEDFITKGIEKSIAFQMKQSKEFEDKLLFSRVTTNQLNEEMKFFGIFGIWFPY